MSLPQDDNLLQIQDKDTGPKSTDMLERSSYPSPPHTNCNPGEAIPLPTTAKNTQVGESGAGFALGFGGILDSPRIDVHASNAFGHWPISPPPTLPTVTASLPCVSRLYTASASDLSLPLAVEEDGRKLILETTESDEQKEEEENESHLLSPLSPGSSFGFGSLETLFEEDQNEEGFAFGTPPHLSLYDDLVPSTSTTETALTTSQQRHDALPHAHRLPYPSPDISPELITLPSPAPRSPFMQDVRLLEPLDFGDDNKYEPYYGQSYEHHYDYDYEHDGIGTQSPSLRSFGLPDLDVDEEQEEDLGLSLSSFPTTTAATAIEVESPPRMGSSSPPSPPSPYPYPSSPLPEDMDEGSVFSDSTSTVTASPINLELEVKHHEGDEDFETVSSTPPLDDSNSTPSPNSGLLLLDIDVDVDRASLASASSSSSSSSTETLLETLDSLIYMLPSILSSSGDPNCAPIPSPSSPAPILPALISSPVPAAPMAAIPHPALSPSLPTLLAHPELHSDLYKLLLLRRQAKERERCAKWLETIDSGANDVAVTAIIRNQTRVDEVGGTTAPMSLTKKAGLDPATAGSIPTRIPVPTQPQSQAARARARKDRKREKERWKEIGSLVELTLVPPPSSSSPEMETSTPIASTPGEVDVESTSSLSKKKNAKEKKKTRVSIMSMAQLVARMILRRRDSGSASVSGSNSNSKPAHELRSPGPRRSTGPYARSPLWQCTTISNLDEDEVEVHADDVNEDKNGLVISGDLNVDEDSDDDLGLGLGPVGLRLKGFL